MRFFIQFPTRNFINDIPLAILRYLDQIADNPKRTQYEITFSNYKFSNTKYIDKSLIIPVGNLEFTHIYFAEHFNTTLIYTHIPSELKHFLNYEHIQTSNLNEIPNNFICTKISPLLPYEEITKTQDTKLTPATYFARQPLEILSEWRIFVFNKNIQDIKLKKGTYKYYPDEQLIQEIISSYKYSPPSYFIDIATNNKQNYLIKVNNFYSCQLFGFDKYEIITQMTIAWFFDLLEQINI